MGPIYHSLGLTVGVDPARGLVPLRPDLHHVRLPADRPPARATRHEAYRADITYGTNNEFGFDYLRDNMKFTLEELRAARAATTRSSTRSTPS